MYNFYTLPNAMFTKVIPKMQFLSWKSINLAVKKSNIADDWSGNTQIDTNRGFLSHRGTPSYHPFLFGVFHEINHP